ncbi:flagellar FlbD family protein [bacterium]|jgi:flagellar protein FlbD|nr:flagellar FlbD family protein [bacterium]MBT4291089.1 flagellar FlbD family protein [bacterium]MBT7310745.1 flagellar FlbD family protein [bacterium]
MINVTKLNGSDLVINADLIEFVESTPDTLISLTTGRKIMVQENLEEIIQLAMKFRRTTRSHPVPAGSGGSVFDGNHSGN